METRRAVRQVTGRTTAGERGQRLSALSDNMV